MYYKSPHPVPRHNGRDSAPQHHPRPLHTNSSALSKQEATIQFRITWRGPASRSASGQTLASALVGAWASTPKRPLAQFIHNTDFGGATAAQRAHDPSVAACPEAAARRRRAADTCTAGLGMRCRLRPVEARPGAALAEQLQG